MVYAVYLLNAFLVIQKIFCQWFGVRTIKIVDKLVRKPKKLILSDLKLKITETPCSCAINPDKSIFWSDFKKNFWSNCLGAHQFVPFLMGVQITTKMWPPPFKFQSNYWIEILNFMKQKFDYNWIELYFKILIWVDQNL